MPNSSRFSDIDPNLAAPTLQRLHQISRLLDKVIAVPGTPIAVGLDPLIGFIPIGGDVLGLLLSSYIISEASRLGVPKGILGRMLLNVIIDSLVGSIPILGDLFDFAWTANEYNLRLLEDYLKFRHSNKA